ncbi:MAG TPA: YraN family protein [bacterium]
MIGLNRKKIGDRGELLARKFFTDKSYIVVARNFRCRYGEIDLVLRKDKSFRFVEVKFRRSMEYGLPQESVIRKKQRRIRNAATYWLRLRHVSVMNTDCDFHFDVLAISESSRGKIEYELIEDAF